MQDHKRIEPFTVACVFEPTARRRLYWCRECGMSAEADPTAETEIINRWCHGRTAAWRPKPGGYGLGDLVAWIAKRLGVRKKPGCGCNQRQAALNRIWNTSTFVRRIRDPREAWRDLLRVLRIR